MQQTRSNGTAAVWAAAMVVGVTTAANATLVTEDFNYNSGNAKVILAGDNGASGWSTPWGRNGAYTSRLYTNNNGANLSYSGGGYSITNAPGVAFGDYGQFRGMNRDLSTVLTGTVWFTALVQNTSSVGHVGVQLNNDNRNLPSPNNFDYTQSGFNIDLAGTSLTVRYNGSDNTGLATGLNLNTTHLLLGKITLDASGSNDRLQIWVDPADLSNLGVAVFDQATADLGSNLRILGIFSYANTDPGPGGQIDALRFSDGGGDANLAFQQVTGVAVGVPTPAALPAGLLLLGGLGLTRRRG